MTALAPEMYELTEATSSAPRRPAARISGFQDAGTSERMYIPFGPRMRVVIELRAPDGARRYILKSSLIIRLSYQEDGTVFASHATLPVHGYGPSEADAVASFADSFDWQWRHIANATDAELTIPARAKRDAMRSFVEEVA